MCSDNVSIINPADYNYMFRLGEYDCYKVRTGICSLSLNEEEYQKALKEERNERYRDGSVSYCRELANNFINRKGYLENTEINMNELSCGHVVFDDGQHRTCISRRMGIEELVCNFNKTNPAYNSKCGPCYYKENNLKNKSLISLLFSTIKKDKNKGMRSNVFIADENFFEL